LHKASFKAYFASVNTVNRMNYAQVTVETNELIWELDIHLLKETQ